MNDVEIDPMKHSMEVYKSKQDAENGIKQLILKQSLKIHLQQKIMIIKLQISLASITEDKVLLLPLNVLKKEKLGHK